MQFGWTADEATSIAVLDSAFEAGVNFIDTADIYSRWAEGNPGGVAETILGRWLAANPSRRGQVVLATKVRGPMGDGPNDAGLSRVHILNAIEASLRRWARRPSIYQNPLARRSVIDETLGCDGHARQSGLVRNISCSNSRRRSSAGLGASARTMGDRMPQPLQPDASLRYERNWVQTGEQVGVTPQSTGRRVPDRQMSMQEVPGGAAGVEPEVQGCLQSPKGPACWSPVAGGKGTVKTVSQVALRWLTRLGHQPQRPPLGRQCGQPWSGGPSPR
jgi:hypothetical protein